MASYIKLTKICNENHTNKKCKKDDAYKHVNNNGLKKLYHILISNSNIYIFVRKNSWTNIY